ncbi:MAG: ABC transporter substrate-binding protein [Rhizobium sp.]
MNWNSISRKCVAVRVRTLLAGAALTLLAGAAVAQDCTPKISDTLLTTAGTLTMATSPTLPPMAFADQNGELKGLRIDIGKEIAKRLCLKPEFVSTEYATMIPGLNGGRWDLVNAGLFVTPERRKILMMIPYENLAISISTAIKSDKAVTKLDDLAGKSISTDIGGYDEKKMRELNEDFKKRGLPEMKISLFDNYATVYQALRAGQVDAAASIDPVAKEYQDRGEFSHALTGLYPTPGSLAFINKDVAEAVSGAMKAMKADGTFDKLMSQYGVLPAPGDLSVLAP